MCFLHFFKGDFVCFLHFFNGDFVTGYGQFPDVLTARCRSNLLIVEPVVLISPLRHKIKTPAIRRVFFILVGVGGFEPPQA